MIRQVDVLGIDIGESLGWAAVEGDVGRQAAIGYGTLKLPTKSTYRARLERINGLLDAWDPEVVAMEDVQFSRFPLAAASYWRIRSLMEMQLECRGWSDRLRVVGVSTLKKWATGKGDAKKPEMCARAKGLFGIDLRARVKGLRGAGSKAHEDIADALLCGAWWLAVGAKG